MSSTLKRALLLTCVLLAAYVQGCGLFSSNQLPIDTSTPYDGPPFTIDAHSGTHIVTFSAPTGGWSAQFNRSEKRFDNTRIFITLIKPPPGSMVTQGFTTLTVETNVAATESIEIFVQTLVFGAPNQSQPYHPANSAQ